ncbi:MAG: CBS domain-containing protein [Candidatus Altiarchaeia archaeon]|jgi:predicted transcriptional regulator
MEPAKQKISIFPDVKSIYKRRKALKWSQHFLAGKANVTQSMINKIENGKISPSYDIVKKIFDELTKGEHTTETQAKDLMNRQPVGLQTDDSVDSAVKKMRSKNFSQLIVYKGEHIVGSISEGRLVESIASGGIKDLKSAIVADIMEGLFPQIDEETPVTIIASILTRSSAVLLTKGNKVTGIMTKADLLRPYGKR